MPIKAISVVKIERKSACREKNEIIVSLIQLFTSPTLSCIEVVISSAFFLPKILYGENKIREITPKKTKPTASTFASSKYKR
ncbi:MAG: hypothetical protein PHU93_01310 [Candidatus Gracilibacteria bacterium]|nr:hypothetical protein [Candidatus Gracilibacteria bacterium]